jgi:heptosyltransferase III
MFFSVLFYIKSLIKSPKKILIIIQRSNGDVLLSSTLINELYRHYESPLIDLFVNDDTYSLAKLLPNINNIYQFSYKKKRDRRFKQEKEIIFNIFKKYDLSINLTASDRSVLYAFLSAKKSISAIEKDGKKSWWKKYLLTDYYYFDTNAHILLNNLKSLKLLKINYELVNKCPKIPNKNMIRVKKLLNKYDIKDFIIFHPSAQYKYKIYQDSLRDKLLLDLSKLGITIVITGSVNKIDSDIKKTLPKLPNIVNLIGETSLGDYLALSELSQAYIGMDTLNMHIAASQNKRIFAIFGPTNLRMWAPWSNILKTSAEFDMPIQNYANITIFQANMQCVACGKAGCDDNHGNSDCLDNINPKTIFKEIEDWHLKSKYIAEIPILNKTYNSRRKILLYIVYGEDQTYYDGAIFSFLTFKNWIIDSDQIEVVVLTEKPEKFSDYPVNLILMSSDQKKEWSINGEYHFRIKNRGMAFVMDKLNLKDHDKILFFDTDTYFHKSPLPLFDLIKSDQAVFYLNEGLIYDRKRFITYVQSLEGKEIKIDEEYYELSKKSALWGSLMVGLTADMRPSLDWSDKLLIKFLDIVPAHTIEEFALSESLLRNYNLVEGKKYVSLYSTSRKKEYASKILSKFFTENKALDFDQQISLAQEVKIKRPLFIVLKQRFLRLFTR